MEAGRTRPLARLTIMRPKLPASSPRRGLTSFQISGRTFLSLGLGREAVSVAAVARPAPREGRSVEGIFGAPILEWPKEDIAFRVPDSGEPLAAGGDEGAHTEEDEEKAKERHGGLFDDRDGMREGGSAAEADDVDVGGDAAQEEQQGHGDGDVHLEHALLCVFRVGQSSEKDEEEAGGAGDEGGGVGAAGRDEAGDGEKDEEDAECDGEFMHL